MESKQREMLREALADYAHKAWSDWMIYLFDKSQVNEDGSVTIPKWAVDRWTRQIKTPYSKLSPTEQELDFIEAAKMVSIMQEHIGM